MLRGEIAHRRRHHADVDDVCAAGANALGKRGSKLGTGKPAIAADDERVTPALEGKRAERLPDGSHDRPGQRLADDTADVVRLEDFACDLHGR